MLFPKLRVASGPERYFLDTHRSMPGFRPATNGWWPWRDTEGPKRPIPCPNLYVASCVQRYLPDPDCVMPAVEGLFTMGRLSGEVHNA